MALGRIDLVGPIDCVRLSLHGGSLLAGFRPGLVTTRLPRAVRSRRSQISTAIGTSPLECPLKIKTIVRISGGSRNRRYETRGSSLSSPPWHSKLLLHTARYAGFRLAVNVPVTPAISTVPLIASLLSAVPL